MKSYQLTFYIFHVCAHLVIPSYHCENVRRSDICHYAGCLR